MNHFSSRFYNFVFYLAFDVSSPSQVWENIHLHECSTNETLFSREPDSCPIGELLPPCVFSDIWMWHAQVKRTFPLSPGKLLSSASGVWDADVKTRGDEVTITDAVAETIWSTDSVHSLVKYGSIFCAASLHLGYFLWRDSPDVVSTPVCPTGWKIDCLIFRQKGDQSDLRLYLNKELVSC